MQYDYYTPSLISESYSAIVRAFFMGKLSEDRGQFSANANGITSNNDRVDIIMRENNFQTADIYGKSHGPKGTDGNVRAAEANTICGVSNHWMQ